MQEHMMGKLSRQDLMSLEDYAAARSSFRADVMAQKKHRFLQLGDHVRLIFESRLTMHYQVQEMLRAEKIFEADGIQEELDQYNPLIPDGCNWKATMMIEYSDVAERQDMLAKMKGIEDRVWVQVGGYDKVWAIADEDLERSNEEKTSAVHFLRFELDTDMAEAMKSGQPLNIGIEHPSCCVQIEPVGEDLHQTLTSDLD
jgi:hypothetical protein